MTPTQPPISLAELLALLTSSGVAVGFVSFFLTWLLWRALGDVAPQHLPGENGRRLVSLVLPFLLPVAAYGAQIALGRATVGAEPAWPGLYIGFTAAGGKQLVYAAYVAYTQRRTPALPQ